MNALDVRPSHRVELEEVFVEMIDEIYRKFRRELASVERTVEESNKELEKGEDPEVVDILEVLEEVLEIGRPERGFPLGFEEFLAALDRVGWDLVRRERKPKLTKANRSAKTWRPRVKRILGETP